MKQRNIKWLLIIEAIVFYFSLLNLVSHIRGPVPYTVDTTAPVVRIQDFTPMADMGVEASETALHIYNTVDGAVAGYTGPLSNLGELECVTIQFQVECPAEFVGNTLIVDLYNYEPSYDNPEQEYHVVLQEGINNISIELLPGQTAPETGELRFFTVNTADYWIENVQVFEKIAQPKVTMPMTFAVVGTALLWLGTLLYGKFRKCRER